MPARDSPRNACQLQDGLTPATLRIRAAVQCGMGNLGVNLLRRTDQVSLSRRYRWRLLLGLVSAGGVR